MKGFVKILIISACFILVGAIVGGIGFALGGRGLVIDGDWNYHFAENDGKIEKNEVLEPFSSAIINIRRGKVSVVAGSEYRIEIKSHSSAFSPTYSVKKGVLEVSSPYSGFTLDIGIFGTFNDSVIVTVPEDKLTSLSVESKAGDVNICGLTGSASGNITVRSSAGEVEIERVHGFGELEIKSSAGQIEMNDVEVGKATVTSSAGSVDIEDFAGSLDLKTSAGGVEVSLKKGVYSEDKYYVELDASAGSVTVDGEKVKGSDRSFGRGSEYRIKIETSAGSIEFKTK